MHWPISVSHKAPEGNCPAGAATAGAAIEWPPKSSSPSDGSGEDLRGLCACEEAGPRQSECPVLEGGAWPEPRTAGDRAMQMK